MDKKQRLQVYNKYNGRCAYCGRKITYKEMQVDHIRPKYIFGSKLPKEELESISNYNPSCRMCNYRKGTLSIAEFREEIRLQAERAMKSFACRMTMAYGLLDYHPEKEVIFYFEHKRKSKKSFLN